MFSLNNCIEEIFMFISIPTTTFFHLLQNVEKLELNGSDFLWQVALSSEEQIANVAIEYLLKLSYHALSPRLKKVCIFENSLGIFFSLSLSFISKWLYY